MSRSTSPRRNLPLLVMHVHEALIQQFRPIIKRHGLTDQQWRVMRAVWAEPDGMEPGQIAEACKLLSPSLTGILTRLQSMGLITRTWSEIDQRRQTIRLTAKGEQLAAAIYPLIEDQYRTIEGRIGVKKFAAIYADLDRILAMIQEQALDESPSGERDAARLASHSGLESRRSSDVRR